MSEIMEFLARLDAIVSINWDVKFAGKTYTVTLALDEFDLVDEQVKGSVEIERKDE